MRKRTRRIVVAGSSPEASPARTVPLCSVARVGAQRAEGTGGSVSAIAERVRASA